MNWPLELEVAHKLAQMRGWLEDQRAGAVRLRGVDWFAWATAGASNSHSHTAECGCAEVLVTRGAAYILTDEAEAMRMREEEVRGPWTWQVSPWMQPQLYELREHFVQHAAGGAPVLSDRPGLHERSLPVALREERLVLLESEQLRYRQVGQLAAGAAADALRQARPDWSEQELAAACVRALWLRGLQAVHVLVSGEDRQHRYRRAPPAQVLLGTQAVLALCARRFGLCASLSRQRRFGPAQRRADGGAVAMDDADAAMLALEAVALDACETGHALSMVYHALDSAYAYAGQPDTVRTSRQGGIHGYLAPEVAAGAHTEILLKRGMALAFHPSLPGSTVEDTFLLDGNQLHNLTHDPAWPSAVVQGRRRPLTLALA
ncbi:MULTISPECIES: M24 family metallopeptidase [Janthinobacterium]|uniref:Peptidase M24 n=1 Tax=Janthinobacterium violaceinigrum TaxID=2654252 RepID=A0A6I1HY24_9BURK|nr:MULTISPECIES: M24 family metallopeptidase [Janthinobacterium]KAB8063613.1 peptidase M24 [Janthinobacterium violaceinigrum]MCX7293609.1 M24 family metallopeptidase [Janthinobacterium sp.]MED5598261.1 M24 family metallopeptidase [Janthinobacterium sp. P210006]